MLRQSLIAALAVVPAAALAQAPVAAPTPAIAAPASLSEAPKPRTVRIGERTVAVDSLVSVPAGEASTRGVRAPASSNAPTPPR